MIKNAKNLRFSYRSRQWMKLVQYSLARFQAKIDSTFGIFSKGFRNKVIVNSIPKAGTNLAVNLIQHSLSYPWFSSYHLDHKYEHFWKQVKSQSAGQIVSLHSYYSDDLVNYLEANDETRMVFIIRDLRDIVISNYHYIAKSDPSHRMHDYLNRFGTEKEKIIALITEIESGLLGNLGRSPSIGEHAARYYEWLLCENVHTVKFEELIDSATQVKAVQGMLEYCGIPYTDASLSALCNQVIGKKSRTLRSGSFGQWQKYFDEDITEVFKETAGEWLIKYGYEENMDW
ncbi:MAG: sulfotransferase domain-containing protein [Puniceicoccaceae bacterium]